MATSNLLAVVPSRGRSQGGDNLRNVKRHHSWLYGHRNTQIFLPIPSNGQSLGAALSTSGKSAGDVMWDDGTSGTAWTATRPTYPCSVVVGKSSNAANTDGSLYLSGYNQFDDLVEEVIAMVAGDSHALSKYAYKELVASELAVAPGTDSNWTVSILGLADWDIEGNDAATNPGCKVGLPFIPKYRSMVPCIQVVSSLTNTGYFYYDGANDQYDYTHANGGIASYNDLAGSTVLDLEAATAMVVGHADTSGQVGIIIHLDPSAADSYL